MDSIIYPLLFFMQILPNAQDIFSRLMKRLKKVYRGLFSNIFDVLL